MSRRTYNFCVFLAQIGLPFVGTLYFALKVVWTLPAAEVVVAPVLVLNTILGLFLGLIDTPCDGHINVEMSEGVKKFTLELEKDPEELEAMTQVVFKINAEQHS